MKTSVAIVTEQNNLSRNEEFNWYNSKNFIDKSYFIPSDLPNYFTKFSKFSPQNLNNNYKNEGISSKKLSHFSKNLNFNNEDYENNQKEKGEEEKMYTLSYQNIYQQTPSFKKILTKNEEDDNGSLKKVTPKKKQIRSTDQGRISSSKVFSFSYQFKRDINPTGEVKTSTISHDYDMGHDLIGSIHRKTVAQIINGTYLNNIKPTNNEIGGPGRVSATDPYIDPATQDHITAYVGSTAIIPCFVNNLGQRSVSITLNQQIDL